MIEEDERYNKVHFTRKEVITALKAININHIAFKQFLKFLQTINPITIHTQETKDLIKDYIYDPDRFDPIVSSIFLLYYELMRDKLDDVDEAYKYFINSPFIQEAMMISELYQTDKVFPDIVFKLITLLTIYNVGDIE